MTPYEKGRAHEYREMEKLREAGYIIVGRAAGSHGEFDIWGIIPPPTPGALGRLKFVQCKSGKTAKRQRKRSMKDLERLAGTYKVEVEAR